MQEVAIYDKSGTITNQILDMDLWKKRSDFNINREILKNNISLIKDLQRIRPDIFIMITDNSNICKPKGIKKISDTLSGIHIIPIGYDSEYSIVRQYFLNGAFDYLLHPVDLKTLENSILRVYEEFGLSYVVNNLQFKVDALIDNIFLGGGLEEYIITNIINQIYSDYKNDPINCQIISDKAKKHIYEILIERKPWLEKFLYKNDFTYYFGFSLKTRKEIINKWIICFKEASAMVTKYQMIDDKLVYKIGKYVVVHVDDKLSLEEVAKGVYLNPSYISHIFKKITGMSFIDYMIEVKMDRAKVLLRDNNIRIYDVANIVGYNNPEYFTKNFKKKTGYAPIEYQRMLEEKYKDE